MDNYTHRNIHSQRRCYIAEETTIDGHQVYYVQVEGLDELQVWGRAAFKTHHIEEETRLANILATEEHAL
ncbi:MAG TPA: hypothetical protein PKE45_20900 [Caldilineaceae bacterium]|nr:hypothetical protein [Caldilineaceae bacterium]